MGYVGNNKYYASVCFPYDVKLPDGAYAFGSLVDKDAWYGDKNSTNNSIKLKMAQIAGNDDDSPTIDGVHNMVIPAGVPALIYVKSATATEYVPVEIATADDCKLTLEQKNYLLNGALTYQYLTQELADAEVGADNTVFVFGQSGGKVGFLRNTNKDYDNVVNNHFVLHNKLYYIGDYGNNASSGAKLIGLQFVSLKDFVSDDEPTGITEMDGDNNRIGSYEDGAVYDLQGRKVENVNRSGVYIINGRKVVIKK